ncbi:biotin--[acetyl-CoA-carboxylase] ligase [Planctomicrobium sp. SH661]|uniref:biotin--[acetyl-CoA-carboxylase] ligase n=1 Tax=Planctomicrobium sp. SH661 TaxID=3448124 RepID=UPI003F5AF476
MSLETSLFNVDRLLAETFLEHALWQAETGSTNTDARELARTDVPLPALIGAENQLQGRGRKNHQWWACSGSLTFSLLLRPADLGIHISQWPLLSLTTGLAVCTALERFLPAAQVRVKWPNDVYVNQQKICGILLETIPELPELLIVGVGINVNNSLAGAPADLQRSATSMLDVAGQPFDRTDVLIGCLQRFADEIQTLSVSQQPVLQRCRERCFLTGRLLTVEDLTMEVTGMCQGIDDDGALRVTTESGPMRFFTGQITMID